MQTNYSSGFAQNTHAKQTKHYLQKRACVAISSAGEDDQNACANNVNIAFVMHALKLRENKYLVL